MPKPGGPAATQTAVVEAAVLEAAVLAENSEATAGIAHSLKGSSATLGAIRLSRLAAGW